MMRSLKSIIERLKSSIRFRSKKEVPLISVVLLLQRPIRLEDDRIHAAIVSAWGRDIREDAKEYVVNKPPVCFVRFGDIILLINNVAKPYVSEEYRRQQASTEFKELRQLKVVLEHSAFFTVDLMYPENPNRKMKQSVYRHMCSLAAEFVDSNCLGVSFPETGHLRPYDGRLKSALKSDDSREEIANWENVQVIRIEDDDAGLRSAESEARSRWPEFVASFNRRQAGQLFSVKAPFRDGENLEWIWVTVSGVTEEAVEGKLGNAPVNLTNVREGDQVRVPVSVISDWLYMNGKNMVGGFSLEVLRRASKR